MCDVRCCDFVFELSLGADGVIVDDGDVNSANAVGSSGMTSP